MRKKITWLIIGLSFFVFSLFLSQTAFAAETTIPQIKVYSPKLDQVQSQFLAYGEKFRGGVSVAAGDVNGDGKVEIITGAGLDEKPQVKIFDSKGKNLGKDFTAYTEFFKGGVKVAVGDVNKDGKDEIITGTGMTGGPQIRVYNGNGKILSQFFAFDKNFKGGVNVAAGDVNGDGKAEIITGSGKTGGPQVRVFNESGKPLWQVVAFANDFRGGVDVAAGDVDGDNRAEVVVSQISSGQAWVKIYRADAKNTLLSNFLAYPKEFLGGTYVAAADLNNDKKAEIITGAGVGGAPQVRLFSGQGVWLGNQAFVYARDYTGGVKIAAKDLNLDSKAEIIVAPSPVMEKIAKCVGACVALTIDDGYSKNGSFESILNTLKRRKVKATFFMLGKIMQARPDLMKRIVNEGHQLANHSYTHGFFTRMPEAQIRHELIYTNDIARSVTGKATKPCFRYPYGAHNANTDRIIKNLGYRYYMWTADSLDSRTSKSVSSVVDNALRGLHSGSIILVHTQAGETAAALETIISEVQKRGYKFATIAEMDP